MLANKKQLDILKVVKVRKVGAMKEGHFPKILGTATLNDKGQLVVPREARQTLGLSSGSKLVIMKSPYRPALILVPAEEVESLVQDLTDALNNSSK